MAARKLWLKDLDYKVGIFVKKSSLQRLKKSKKISFRNSPVTRQHNISLNETKSKIAYLGNVLSTCSPTCKACQCDTNIACNSAIATV